MNLHNTLDINSAFEVSWIDDAKYGEIKGRAFQIVVYSRCHPDRP